MSTKSYTGRVTGTQITMWAPGNSAPRKQHSLKKSNKLHQTITGTVKQAAQRIALNYIHESTTRIRICDTVALFVYVDLWPSALPGKVETWCLEYRLGDLVPRTQARLVRLP